MTPLSIQAYENNDRSFTDNESQSVDEENISSIIPNLFDSALLSNDYCTTFTFNINDPRKLFLYTMTIGTVQLNSSLLIPYSVLSGRRPLLQPSNTTNFKPVRSKQRKHIYRVTAIESSTNMDYLKENDIIIKVRYIEYLSKNS